MGFVLLKIFALLLNLLYARRKRYYAEHFVFALHVHAFVFLMFVIILLIREPSRDRRPLVLDHAARLARDEARLRPGVLPYDLQVLAARPRLFHASQPGYGGDSRGRAAGVKVGIARVPATAPRPAAAMDRTCVTAQRSASMFR